MGDERKPTLRTRLAAALIDLAFAIDPRLYAVVNRKHVGDRKYGYLDKGRDL